MSLGVFIIPQIGRDGGYRHQEYSKEGANSGRSCNRCPDLAYGGHSLGSNRDSGFKAHDWNRVAKIDFDSPTVEDVPILTSLFADQPGEVVQRAYDALEKIGAWGEPPYLASLKFLTTPTMSARSLLSLDGLLFMPEPEVTTVAPEALKTFLEHERDPKLYAQAWRMLTKLKDWMEYEARKVNGT